MGAQEGRGVHSKQKLFTIYLPLPYLEGVENISFDTFSHHRKQQYKVSNETAVVLTLIVACLVFYLYIFKSVVQKNILQGLLKKTFLFLEDPFPQQF